MEIAGNRIFLVIGRSMGEHSVILGAYTSIDLARAKIATVEPGRHDALDIEAHRLDGKLERAEGIEPSSSTWKDVALPLS